ncbi:glycine cleavage system protein P [Caldisphaera lagunensis DSM 15908]|uniref:Probable glycine dehydrogenase (decarboxylating) subunit 2 n=1 Tax=Caldisphaera lagunensis (strain DSM 15908 / JCM 11604 / ANMR 0165 / IC-154) TaxID=1056495 RepID=L0A9B6_CALLD|nr:aminomethyl-transferring glycine dehydrogenase subunit GcvPB [Caldisphaera lagunensis]AFZ70466.1 glycine cleavage system protein P [Caldisphaera lagunensis DSM 15908]
MFKQANWNEPLIYELGNTRKGIGFKENNEEFKQILGEISIPQNLKREKDPDLPEVSEIEVVRHFTRLSEMAYGVDSGPVPLGSCTMKYNPKLSLKISSDKRLTFIHPLQPESTIQGLLKALYELQNWLSLITGMDYCTLHPAAGAQGELSGVLMIRKYHEIKGNINLKDEIIVPDSAHGTNPASAAMGGFKTIEIPTDESGNMDYNAFLSSLNERTAGLMLTNPSTLGLFEEKILDVAKMVHEKDGLLYYDGANLNGILGKARPGDMGFDMAHLNLHKTFSTPHGGGGPGSGPLCIKDRIVKDDIMLHDLLPGPIVIYDKKDKMYKIKWPGKNSPGLMKSFFGNVQQLIWAYTYILTLGPQGLREAGEVAVINTNYFIKLMENSKGYSLPYGNNRFRKHEVVLSAEPLHEETGVTAEDISKGLLDSGFYAPTIYFPLIVKEALMIEFTESETKENIEKFANRLKEIEDIARRNPNEPKQWPLNTSVRRIDMVKANHPKTITPTYRANILRQKGILGPLR